MSIVRIFGKDTVPCSAETVGAKAANLARMAALGLPVPPAFVLPVDLCADIIANQADAEQRLRDGLRSGIRFLEQATGRVFGDHRQPLLVSVRSGAARSMPGMLDTVLNVGCTSAAARGLMRSTGRPRLAFDCRRRLIESFSETVLGLEATRLTALCRDLVTQEGVATDRELDSEAIARLAADEQALVETGSDGWLEDAEGQLHAAARAVYQSWASERAQTYRKLQNLEHLPGTAVTVQAMVFGNGGLASGAGVAFSRDPSTGAKLPMIDLVLDAQGEDVVSGRRTPDSEETIARALPNLRTELVAVLRRLETEFGDVQDVEFTVEDGRLWILQTRAAKRTPRAALKIAVDLVHERVISPQQALQRLEEIDLEQLVETSLVAAGEPAATGIAASGGIAVGRAAFDSESAKRLADSGEPVILMRPDTSTADIAGFAAAAGVVTTVGARTAHAALVARQLGRPCIVGCPALTVSGGAERALLGTTAIARGDWVTIDGDQGRVYCGRLEIVTARPDAELAEVAAWRRGDLQPVRRLSA
ncbi:MULTISPECIES: PEP/pyruvate-binding domain-containing protein [Bradyrhizobium]|jgi:pyruvate,orthophosphate dikinase|uniref:Pyruvate, phosphate dikinase n=4 Tax=Bradyrhizobium TaxID=374 RepID=A0ABS5G9M4_9BRAD|nr:MULTISPECIES: PEP/pyruvate-binding domain-containing protein [Bradyrhizobium]MBR1137963.1 pyruvate, phosphate dikinase [Bradyrhizobium denitrificans]MDU1493483.1 PEP/pyruvate-binding domain-containing protein [Bradyrhizobium sp.]MDU1543778.1 PEP/pyruvate-binding domain-containing protein [Bradyrhizobium sp.]MDU1690502.1 PEP/pyruvate-binding domain-containing protein [Bradyrhizobium sp.]MDU1806914.1 PEP/pyruvate-binding domain-containing protein [Bradyrhizobium sp.]